MESLFTIPALGFVQEKFRVWRRHPVSEALVFGHVRLLFHFHGKAAGLSPTLVSRFVDIDGGLVLSSWRAICRQNGSLSIRRNFRRVNGAFATDRQFWRARDP